MSAPAPHDSDFDPVLCATCGGRCCQAHPGLWLEPARFFAALALPAVHDPTELAALLPAELTLRDLLGVPVPVPQSTAAGCVLLTPDGCRLGPDQRPCQCLALIPDVATQLEGEIRCALRPDHGSAVAHARWQAWWRPAAPR